MNVRSALCWVSLGTFIVGCGGVVQAVPNASAPETLRSSAASSTIPYFSSVFTYQGQGYAYTMVGTDPRTDPKTTTVTAHVVPVKLTFSNNEALDATSLASRAVSSPLFKSVQFPEGTTQFGDAVMREEFWKYASSRHGYHVLLSAAPIEPTVSVAVPSSDGYTKAGSSGQNGYVAYSWFVSTIEPQIIDQLKIPPTDLTIFITSRTSVLEPGGYCCYLGYHSVFRDSSLAHTWTTAWSSVTNKSIEYLSHEVAEWLNDPFYNNNVPAWVSPESGACGGRQLEVGDPVTLYRIKKGGFAMQDVAFFSWFARQTPSVGFQGRYDLGGKLHAPAANCPT
jgi:hypothetical protein